MNRHILIDPYWLAGRYVSEEVSASAIAGQLGCSAQTVRRRLRAHGIRVRPRGPRPRRVAPIEWSPELAWVVGLMATDGNLGRGRASLSLVSRDMDLLESARRCLGPDLRITRHGPKCLRLQWRDRDFYRWLVSVGLTPAKSRTLGPVAVPDHLFADFLRGCVDGDGSVQVYTDRQHASKNERYVYERLYVSVFSASHRFTEWLQSTIARLFGVNGSISSRHQPGRTRMWRVRYAKAESVRLLGLMYYAPDVPCLLRKRAVAMKFLVPLGESAGRGIGRPRVGWIYNKAADSGRGGGTGMHVALKTPCPQGLAGSNPAPGTNLP